MIEQLILALIILGSLLMHLIYRGNNKRRSAIIDRSLDQIEAHDKRIEELRYTSSRLRTDVGKMDRRLGSVQWQLRHLTPVPELPHICARCSGQVDPDVARVCPSSKDGLDCCPFWHPDEDQEDP